VPLTLNEQTDQDHNGDQYDPRTKDQRRDLESFDRAHDVPAGVITPSPHSGDAPTIPSATSTEWFWRMPISGEQPVSDRMPPSP
jgi:hypothetical protein